MPNLFHFSDEERKPIELKTFIDLFAGIGGFRLAFESLGLKCVFSSEWDKAAQKTYFNNFREKPHGDITKIDAKEIGPHDMICAGFPCQAFSISGKQKGFQDSRGTLFFDIARIAAYWKPKVTFLENVKNLAAHDNKNTLKTIIRILNDLDYDVYHKVLNSGDYGVPTSRKRIYIVCFRKDLEVKTFSFPEATNEKVFVRDILETDVSDEFSINRDDIILSPKITKPQQKPIRVGVINNGGQGERIYSVDGHAITLSAYGGGAAAKTGAYLVSGKVRKLTPRECARVMGYPDSYILPSEKNLAYKQLGNSVTVPVIWKIGRQIIDACEVKK